MQQQMRRLGKLIHQCVFSIFKFQFSSLLRGNNSLSKLEVELSKQCGRSWLALTLGPIMDKASKDSAFYEGKF